MLATPDWGSTEAPSRPTAVFWSWEPCSGHLPTLRVLNVPGVPRTYTTCASEVFFWLLVGTNVYFFLLFIDWIVNIMILHELFLLLYPQSWVKFLNSRRELINIEWMGDCPSPCLGKSKVTAADPRGCHGSWRPSTLFKAAGMSLVYDQKLLTPPACNKRPTSEWFWWHSDFFLFLFT